MFEDIYNSAGAASGLADIAGDLGALEDEVGDLGAPNLRDRLKRIRGKAARRAVTGLAAWGLSPADVKGKVIVPSTIYTGRTLPASFAHGETLSFWHYGIGDDANSFGNYAVAGTNKAATYRQTNLAAGGRIHQDEVFVLFGISFQFSTDATLTGTNADLGPDFGPTDLQRLGSSGHVHYTEKQGAVNIPRGRLLDFPCATRVAAQYGTGSAGDNVYGAYIAGRPNVQRKPLTVIRGNLAQADMPRVNVQINCMPQVATLNLLATANLEMFCIGHGVALKHPSRT